MTKYYDEFTDEELKANEKENEKMLKDPFHIDRLKKAIKGNRKSVSERLAELEALFGAKLYCHYALTDEINKDTELLNVYRKRHEGLKKATYKTFNKWFDKYVCYNRWEKVNEVSELLNIEVIKGYIATLANKKLTLSEQKTLLELFEKME